MCSSLKWITYLVSIDTYLSQPELNTWKYIPNHAYMDISLFSLDKRILKC